MNRLKTLAVAACAVTAIALTAMAGSASATRLCKQAEETCAAGNIYKAATNITASLASKTVVRFRVPEVMTIECTSSTINAKTSNEGGLGERVKAAITSETFGGCMGGTVTVNLDGFLRFEYSTALVGTGIAYLTGENSITLKSGTVECTYGETPETPERPIMVNGSTTAPTYTMTDSETELILLKGGAACKMTGARLNATYNLSAPTSLFVVKE